MRIFLIVVFVLLLSLLVIGFFSSGIISDTNTTEEPAATKLPSFTYSQSKPKEASNLLCSLYNGISEPSGGASSGYISNEKEGYTMIGVSFKNLTPGTTYTLFYDIDTDYIQYYNPSAYYLRTGGLSSYDFAEVPISFDLEPYGEGYVTFVADTSSVELFILRLGFLSNESMIDAYHSDLILHSAFKLYGA